MSLWKQIHSQLLHLTTFDSLVAGVEASKPPDVVKPVNSRSPLHRCARAVLGEFAVHTNPFSLFASPRLHSPLPPPPLPPPPASHHWACRAQLPLAGIANTKKSCSCEPRTSRRKRTSTRRALQEDGGVPSRRTLRNRQRWRQHLARSNPTQGKSLLFIKMTDKSVM